MENVCLNFINEEPLSILPSLAKTIGLNEAIIVQQIYNHFKTTKTLKIINEELFICSRYEDWMRQFPFWSKSTIKRTIKNLKQNGIIVVEQLKRNNFYRIDYKILDKILEKGSI